MLKAGKICTPEQIDRLINPPLVYTQAHPQYLEVSKILEKYTKNKKIAKYIAKEILDVLKTKIEPIRMED